MLAGVAAAGAGVLFAVIAAEGAGVDALVAASEEALLLRLLFDVELEEDALFPAEAVVAAAGVLAAAFVDVPLEVLLFLVFFADGAFDADAALLFSFAVVDALLSVCAFFFRDFFVVVELVAVFWSEVLCAWITHDSGPATRIAASASGNKPLRGFSFIEFSLHFDCSCFSAPGDESATACIRCRDAILLPVDRLVKPGTWISHGCNIAFSALTATYLVYCVF